MQDQYLKSPILSEEVSNQVDRLVKQLDQIKYISKSGFWLSTEELAILLRLESSFIEKLNLEITSQDQNYSFVWRNFECHLVEKQFSQGFWVISDRQDLSSNPVLSSSQKSGISLTVNESPPSSNKSSANKGFLIDVSPQEIVPSPYALIDNFLSPSQLSELLSYSINKYPEFVPTINFANDPNYRRSLYLPHFPEFSELIVGLVRKITPQIISHLGISNFVIGQIESQLTAHNHDNYYKIHNDSGSPDTDTRVLTYVYYYHREPKGFTGGELVLYNSKVENGTYVAADSHKVIQPTNNTIVFFPSHCMHEVLPVACPSEYFADSRFTVNGWVRHI